VYEHDEHRRCIAMSHVRRFDHVAITVADLDTVTAFFVGLGLEVEGTRMFVEGDFLDTVSGIPDFRTEIVTLQAPNGGTRLELSGWSAGSAGTSTYGAWPTSADRRASSCPWRSGSADDSS
jgi:catechol 2,3-dioxygenase-like lactoylglutathione lyase family enzyme